MPALDRCCGRKVCIRYMWEGWSVPAAHARFVQLHLALRARRAVKEICLG